MYLSSEKNTLTADRTITPARNISHIIPDVLYPAVENKLMNGSTSHVGNYGTAQVDGLSYYYTDIKGSKPIKDPRIGAHFGSQRYTFRSLQNLVQETETHDRLIHSIDGREFIRISCAPNDLSNDSNGPNITLYGTNDWFEVTGYFNAVSVSLFVSDSTRTANIYIDGVQAHSALAMGASINTPLGGRYVSSTSLKNIDITSASSLSSDTTLGIHTFRFQVSQNVNITLNAVELTAQDTTSTATKSQIQIPSQNVLSFGRKFTVAAATPHYDPFNGFVNSTSLHSDFVDTATSLGLSTPIALHGAPWAISSSNNIRPYNGGRVVIWVDSAGGINTSVNMMPPNAQNIGLTAAVEITTPSATNTAFKPAMSNDAIDNSLAEIAKTFHQREFGNGFANSNTTWRDNTALNTSTQYNISYVMDDGLTACAGSTCESGNATGSEEVNTLKPGGYNAHWFITFIGTGISFPKADGWLASDSTSLGNPISRNVVQNLPYGTHIIKGQRESGGSQNNGYVKVDGVTVKSDLMNPSIQDIAIHQPKRPPIPEDAVVIADYMLMADFVPASSAGIDLVSKGIRLQSVSRDVFFETTNANFVFQQEISYHHGFRAYLNGAAGSATSLKYRLPSFATNFSHRGFNSTARSNLYIDDTEETGVTAVGTDEGSLQHLTSDKVLGVYNLGSNAVSGENAITSGFEIATPIHTSSHYQSFETPYTHDLIGGDRNMEQTNLVVTPDGKTWNEVTRDTSYIGNVVFAAGELNTNVTASAVISGITDFRGNLAANGRWSGIQKEYFTFAMDRFICLKDGQYKFDMSFRGATNPNTRTRVLANRTTFADDGGVYLGYTSYDVLQCWSIPPLTMKRGDYYYMLNEGGAHNGSADMGLKVQITKL